MFITEESQEWMKKFLRRMSRGPERGTPATDETPYPFLGPALDAQRTMLSIYRQLLEGSDSSHSLDEYQAELLRGTLEGMRPFLKTEQEVRQRFVKAQALMLELCDETLRSFATGGEKRGAAKS